MSPTPNLGDRTWIFSDWIVKCGEPGIGIRLQEAAETAQISGRVLGLAIRAEEVGGGRRGVPRNGRSSRTKVHNRPVRVRPRPGARAATGVSPPWIFSAANTWARMPSAIGASSHGYLANIIGEGRPAQINALAPVDFALPVQRQMIEVFRHHDHGEQRGCRAATQDRQAGAGA